MPRKETGKVNISVTRETAEQLNKVKKYGETWDSLLLRLLRGAQER